MPTPEVSGGRPGFVAATQDIWVREDTAVCQQETAGLAMGEGRSGGSQHRVGKVARVP